MIKCLPFRLDVHYFPIGPQKTAAAGQGLMLIRIAILKSLGGKSCIINFI